jgi:hypothetical protein
MKENRQSPILESDFQIKFNQWAIKNDRKLFLGFLIISVLFSFLSFNARISEAHDDALYLEGGWRYVNEFPNYFYTQNAPLYVMFLGGMIKVFGFKLILFKIASLFFNLTGLALFYKAFKGRLPAMVFLPVVLFQAINYLVMYYASMTFTEAFYFCLQGFFFYRAMKIIDLTATEVPNLRTQWQNWLWLGLSMFLMSTAKSAAIVVLPAIVLYFALNRQYKAIGFSLGAYMVFKVVYEALVRIVWGTQNQFAGQGKILLQKDPYDISQGNETAGGFVTRLIENTNLSLSKRFYQLLGFMDEGSLETNWFLTLLTLGLALFGFWVALKSKNKLLILAALFAGSQLALSYIILQVRWDQPRITLVCMPVVLFLMLYGLYKLTSKGGFGQMAFVVIILLISGSVLGSTFSRSMKNLPIVKKNMKGDKYFGYTPDWQNFLRCSEWCADNLGATDLVASRKAPMSFVYGKGKKFFPIYSVIKKDSVTNQSHPDSALAFFKKNNVTHIMMGHLRLNPGEQANGFINTIHNILFPIARQYPEKLELVHVESMSGFMVDPSLVNNPAQLIVQSGQFEECYVFKINY